jgi:hypothetical protein
MYQSQINRTIIFGVAAALLFWSNAMAEMIVDAGGTETGATDTTVVTGTETGTGDGGTGDGTTDGGTGDTAGAFDRLSTGGRKHAKSLFDAQQAGEGGEVLSLDDIALAKQETGWGNVFKQMKEDGLVLEKNFGQIVSGRGKTDETIDTGESTETGTDTGSTTAAASGTSNGYFAKPKRTKLVVTTANGGRVTFGLKKPGSKSRSFTKGSDAKGSAARKVLRVSSRQSGRRTHITSGRGKLSGLTSGRR